MRIAVISRPDDRRLIYLYKKFSENNLKIELIVMARKKDKKADTLRRIKEMVNKVLISGQKNTIVFPEEMRRITMKTQDQNSDEVKQALIERKIDVIFLSKAGIIKPNIINGPWKIVNCHPAILPRYRGLGSCEWAVYNGGPLGVTAHFIDAGVDTGNILHREFVKPLAEETYHEFRKRIDFIGVDVMLKMAKMFIVNQSIPEEFQTLDMGVLYRRKPFPGEMTYIIKAFVNLRNGNV